jgi:hypothetical protein
MIPLAQWAMKNYTPEVRNVGLNPEVGQKLSNLILFWENNLP